MNDPTPTQSAGEIVEDWFTKHFHNSVASRNTEIYNLLHAAKEDLKTLLNGKQAVPVVEVESNPEEKD